MPIEYTIDHKDRTVFAQIVGNLTTEELYNYQDAVWAREEIRGYSELTDLSGVGEIVRPSPVAVKDLADAAVQIDPPLSCERKVAIVAPDDRTYGLSRMYEQFRSANPASRSTLRVFRCMAEARKWLGLSD